MQVSRHGVSHAAVRFSGARVADRRQPRGEFRHDESAPPPPLNRAGDAFAEPVLRSATDRLRPWRGTTGRSPRFGWSFLARSVEAPVRLSPPGTRATPPPISQRRRRQCRLRPPIWSRNHPCRRHVCRFRLRKPPRHSTLPDRTRSEAQPVKTPLLRLLVCVSRSCAAGAWRRAQ